jgi:hypothetical protein
MTVNMKEYKRSFQARSFPPLSSCGGGNRDAFAFCELYRRTEVSIRLSREGKLELTEESRLSQP